MQSITLHNLPKVSTNQIYAGKHWGFRKKLKDQFLWLTLPVKNLRPVKEKIDLEFIFHFASKPLDASNCSFSGKMLEDCLIHYKIIPNDTLEHIRKLSYESRKSESENDFCEIKLIPCSV